jgi:predicted MFS family arabinose efflux permease
VLLYPVYALLFGDTGLSTAEISSLFALWSITGFVLEVPSGALADATSRRALLVAGPLLTAAGFALWVAVPSYAAFAAGFVLWGAGGSLQSGAFEALVHDELDRLGAASSYARVVGRATAAATAAVALATALAAPVFAAGGYVALGVASVVAGIAAAAVAATLPEHRAPVEEAEGGIWRGQAKALAGGLAEVRSAPAVLTALLVLAPLAAIWGALDEYLGLLAREDAGIPTAGVPLAILAVYVAMTAGGLVAGRVDRWPPRRLGLALAVAAIALGWGALSATPAGFLGIAAAFCAFQALTVVADARLQDAISGPARATVTSLAGLATEVQTVAVYVAYGAGSAFLGNGTLFALFAGLYLLLAIALARGGRAGYERRPAEPSG